MKKYVVTCGPLAVVLTDEQAREMEYLSRWRAGKDEKQGD